VASEGAALAQAQPARRLPAALVAVLAGAAVMFALLLPLDGRFPWWLLLVLAAGFVAWALSIPAAAACDSAVIPLVAALCAVGILIVSRLDVALGSRQVIWMILGLAVVIFGQRLFLAYRRLENVTYLWVILSLALFLLLGVFGTEVNGARLWFRIGAFTAQPVEVIKLFMVFFMAAYLAKHGTALASLRFMDVGATFRLLWPLLLVWGIAIASLGLQRDFGMAGLFLGIFLVMLYVASRRLDVVVISALLFVAGAWLLARSFPYVEARIAVWLNPWSDPLGRGYQAEQGYFSLAAGSLLGTGYHLGHPGFIPDAATDYPFAAIAEEFGLLGGLAVIALYGALVLRGLRIGFFARDSFTALLAVGFASILGIQVAIIVGGVVGLFPLTGITLPFISYGGSSVVANLLMMNFLWVFSGTEQAGSGVGANPSGPTDNQ
jgi:cell division protein FtsW (lipid II flippase)